RGCAFRFAVALQEARDRRGGVPALAAGDRHRARRSAPGVGDIAARQATHADRVRRALDRARRVRRQRPRARPADRLRGHPVGYRRRERHRRRHRPHLGLVGNNGESLMLDVKFALKRMARNALAPLLYRYPPFTLAPERLYLFMHTLIETRAIPGAVVEIGCNLGGTAIIAR